MSKTEWIDDVANNLDDEILRIDGFDDCVVGLIERPNMQPVLLYSRDAIIAKLVDQGANQEAAEEYYAVNIADAWVGDGTPAFLVGTAPEDDGEGTD